MDKKVIIGNALTKKRDELIVSLWWKGYSYSDIAIIFKIAHTTVSRIIARDLKLDK